MKDKKLNVIVTGKDIGEFLAFYFNEECFKDYKDEQWELSFYKGGQVIPDIAEFRVSIPVHITPLVRSQETAIPAKWKP